MNSLIAKLYKPSQGAKPSVEGAVALDFNMKAFRILNETDLPMAEGNGGGANRYFYFIIDK
jgi:hypothetical protein